VSPVEYAGGKRSLRAYTAVCLQIHCNPLSYYLVLLSAFLADINRFITYLTNIVIILIITIVVVIVSFTNKRRAYAFLLSEVQKLILLT